MKHHWDNSSKKPPCFDMLDTILSDKPTTMSPFLASFSGVTDKGSDKPDSFVGENLVTSDIDMAEGILNSTQSIYYLWHLHLLQIQHEVNKKVVSQVVVFILISPKKPMKNGMLN